MNCRSRSKERVTTVTSMTNTARHGFLGGTPQVPQTMTNPFSLKGCHGLAETGDPESPLGRWNAAEAQARARWPLCCPRCGTPLEQCVPTFDVPSWECPCGYRFDGGEA
jgi:hypothetical protein